MFDLKGLLKNALELGASDVHLEEGAQPALRINGEMNFLDMPILGPDDIEDIFDEVFDGNMSEEYVQYGDTDFSYNVPGLCRFRVNALNQYCGRGLVMRIISTEIPTIDGLNLPRALKDIAELHKGLVLVTGPTGCGKSTTLAAIVNHINSMRAAHIITIEDPVEFVHPPIKSYIEHRQIGTHTPSFSSALTASLRESPDVIMVGEMRDLETIRQALRAAETGHLVLGTLHTISVAQTASRLIDVFPADEQPQVRSLVSSVLKAVICQQLIRSRRGGRVAAMEIMINNQSISSLLREGRLAQMRTFMMMGHNEGMQTLDFHLRELIKAKHIDYNTALDYASAPDALERDDDDLSFFGL